MKTVKLNLKEFRKHPDACLVISFMMAINDIERMIFIREVLEKLPVQERVTTGSFHRSLEGYTANVLIAHICEAYQILKKIEKSTNRKIHQTIAAHADLKLAFLEACKFIDDKKDPSSSMSPYDNLLGRWKDFRDVVIFHYNPEGNEIREGLDLVADTYGYSTAYIGQDKERPFYELAFEVVDAIGSKTFDFKYGDQSASITLVANVRPMIKSLREFAGHLVARVAED